MFFRITLLLALIVRIYFIVSVDYISPDGTQYASIGYNIVHEGVYNSNGSHFPDIIQPPLYPFLLGILTILFSPILSGKLISLIFGLLLIWLARKFIIGVNQNKFQGDIGAFVIAIHPAFISISSQVVTESVYIFFIAGTVYFGWKAYANHSYKNGIILGCYISLAFLTRPEALLFFFVILLFFLVRLFTDFEIIKVILTFFLIFILVSGIYGFWVKTHTGYFSFSPKIEFVNSQGKLLRFYKATEREKWEKLENKEHNYFIRYGLTPDGTELASKAFFYKYNPVYQSVTNTLKKTENDSSRLPKLLGLMLINLKKIASKIIYGSLFPLPLLILSIIFVFFIAKKGFDKKLLLYSAIMSLPFFSYLITHIEERFFYALWPIWIWLFAIGMFRIKESFLYLQKSRNLAILAGLLFLLHLPYYVFEWNNLNEKNYYQQLGSFLKTKLDHDTKIAAAVPQAVFFADKKYAPLPFAEPDKAFRFFKAQNIDYVLIEKKDLEIYSSYSKIINAGDENLLYELKLARSGNHPFWLVKIR